jgi:hypothetical protein
VEWHLSSKYESLSSNLSTTKKCFTHTHTCEWMDEYMLYICVYIHVAKCIKNII